MKPLAQCLSGIQILLTVKINGILHYKVGTYILPVEDDFAPEHSEGWQQSPRLIKTYVLRGV